MGFLDSGTPLSWSDSASVREYVKYHGITQLLNMWRANKDRQDSIASLRWGEELEYILADTAPDHSDGCRQESTPSRAALHLDAANIIASLNEGERSGASPVHKWLPEFANYMVEATPGVPYSLDLDSLLTMEENVQLRRIKLQAALPANVYVTSLTAFPREGLPDSYRDDSTAPDPANSKSKSIFIADQIINPHPRFGTLVQNICSRRQAKPFIQIPLFEDARTYDSDDFWRDSREAASVDRFSAQQLAESVTVNPVKGSIYMDCFAFGMGMSCVQTTMGAPTIQAARYMYDQLLVLAPLFLALTASTPCLRGLLANTDTRWSTLEQAVDCRTEDEEKSGRIPKSRYSGASLYLSRDLSRVSALNNSVVPINEEVKKRLESNGMDEALAKHYGHLWIRDPMVIFSEKVQQVDDATMGDHFENIQSTNWNSVRFKPPPLISTPDSTPDPPAHPTIPWRVEFRTPEIQLTEFENTAQVAFISVLAQILLRNYLLREGRGRESSCGSRSYDRLHSLWIPMTLNDDNMKRSWERDAIVKQKFHFPDLSSGEGGGFLVRSHAEGSLEEIFLGNKAGAGLLQMAKDYVADQVDLGLCDRRVMDKFERYGELISGKVSGELQTSAQFLRRFMMEHPAYKEDSKISPEICHDVTVLAVHLGLGSWKAPALCGRNASACPDLHEQLKKVSSKLPSFSKHININSDVTKAMPCLSGIMFKTSLPHALPSVASMGRLTNWDVVSTEDLSLHYLVKKDEIAALVTTPLAAPYTSICASPVCRVATPRPATRRSLRASRALKHSKSRLCWGTKTRQPIPPCCRRSIPCFCCECPDDLAYYAQVCEASA